MAEVKETKQCAHPGCICNARPDSKYCGTWCEGAKGKPEVQCACGHPGCK